MARPSPTTASPSFSSERLEANLGALERVDAALVRRLRFPVDGNHVDLEDPRGPRYRLHRGTHALGLPARDARAAVAGGGAEPLVFGVGLGELLLAALAERKRVTAWERDPWLLRLTLAAHDLRAPISDGSLALKLGVDVLDLAADSFSGVVAHPLLGQIYQRELALLARDRTKPLVALCEGGLFVDALGREMTRREMLPYTLDVERLAIEELAFALMRLKPELVLSVNYRDGLAEFCAGRGAPLIVWEIDPCLSFLAPLREPCPQAFLFTYREAHVEHYRAAGFENVEYLPLAADPAARMPLVLDEEQRERYAAPVAFVGSSLQLEAEACFERFNTLAEAMGQVSPQKLVEGALGEFVRARNPAHGFEAFLEGAAPGFRSKARAAGEADPLQLLGEIVAAKRRAESIRSLAPLGVEVWGDNGWERVEGVRYRGSAGHTHEINRIYAGAQVQVDLGRAYQSDIVTMRVFDAMACGAFLLTEESKALATMFEVGRDVAVHWGPTQLQERVRYFLERPEEAAEIARRGHELVLKHHTIAIRVEHMLERLRATSRRT